METKPKKNTAKVRKPEYIISNYSSDPSFNEYFESSQVTIDTSYGTPNDFTKDYRLSFVVLRDMAQSFLS